MPGTSDIEPWISAAFAQQPGWEIKARQSIKSFQQQMTRITLGWPTSSHTTDVYVRFYQSQLSWWTRIAPDLPQREYSATLIAQRGGLPVAPFLYVGTIDDQQGAVIGHVPGSTGWTPDSLPFVLNLADALARLHSIPIGARDRTHLPDCTLAALLGRLAAWAKEIGATQLQSDLAACTERIAQVVERPAVLIHGDCHPNNIIRDGDQVTAFIDWEEAAFGDPRIDLCWLAHAIQRHDPLLAEQFLRAYEQQVGFTVGDLQIWSELLEVRYQIVYAWIQYALAQQIPLPSANPDAWPA